VDEFFFVQADDQGMIMCHVFIWNPRPKDGTPCSAIQWFSRVFKMRCIFRQLEDTEEI
jgi:hypothetical protein